MLKKKEKLEKQKEQKQETENKIGIKEKIKRFLKNKKAVAMLMEYIITIECFAMLFLLIAPEEVKAATSIADANGITWAYTLDENGNATNVYYESGELGETVTIPSTISDGTNEYPVVSLYNSSGSYRNIFTKTNSGSNTTVKKVIIPDGVTSMGARIFYNCNSLTSVEIPEGVTSIGVDAFSGCSSLTSVEIPSSVTSIESSAFYNCSSLTSITVDENNPNYSSENDILYNKDKTTLIKCAGGKAGEVIIPSSVTSIGSDAFKRCSSLINVVIPEGVTNIGVSAFSECTNLTSVVIPEGVTWIANNAFSECRSLTSVEIPEGVTRIEYATFRGCSSLTSVEIPSSLTIIDGYAFYGCSSLTSAVIPEGVTEIRYYAFQGCSSLTSINIPNSVTTIEKYAFRYCSSLTSVKIGNGVTSIEELTFDGCTSLEKLTVDENNPNYSSREDILYNKNKTILIYCANGKKGEVIVPEGVTSLRRWAFMGCKSLTSIVIPNSVTSIEAQAFQDCSGLRSVNVPEEVSSIEAQVFYNCSSLISVGIPEGVTSIGNYAFYSCSSLTSVVIPSSVTSIGSYAFHRCSSLTDIYIGNIQSNITFESGWKAWTYAFVHYSDCKHTITQSVETGLKIEEISDNLETGTIACRETYQFKVVNEQGEMVINKKVKVTSQGQFTNSAEVTEYIMPNEEGIYAIENISRNIAIKIGMENGETAQATDENGITWNYTYQDGKATNVYYESGTLPEEVTIPSILDGYPVVSLYNNSGSWRNIFTKINSGRNTTVKKVIIPEGVTSIGNNAFYYCSSLTSVEIPKGVTSIGNYAFYSCSSLTSVEIPKGVTSIGSNAFEYCSSLISIEIPEGVTDLGSFAFEYCNSLISVKILEGVTSIKTQAFCNCSSLTSVEIPSSVSSIGFSAFNSCSSLTSVVIPEGVTRIESYAFYRCSSLTDIYIDNLQSNITFGGDLKSNTNAYVHYKDCKHDMIKYILVDGLQIQEISNNLEDGKITCGETYRFKVVNEQGETVTKEKVRVISQGQFTNSSNATEFLNADEEGVYKIENVNRNKTITIEKIRNGGKYQATDENGITWNYTYQDDKATNVYYERGILPSTVIIPSTLDGYQVVSLYNNGRSYRNIFYGSNTTVKEVIIPEGVTRIGSYAFNNCSSLTSLEIPSTVTKIEYGAFYGCNGLPDIYIDNLQANVECQEVGSYVHFTDCKHEIKKNVDPRTKLKIEEISNNLQNGKIACGETYRFKVVNEEGEVITTEEVKVKSQGQFTYYSEVTGLLFSNEEGIYTIENVNRNKQIIIGAENGETAQGTDENGIIWEYKYEEGKARALKYISGEMPETLEVPAKIDGLVVTTMADGALKGSSVKNVILPDSIINIGASAFENCTELETIVLPEGLQLISNSALKGCTNLKQVELPDDLLVIGNEAFSGCTSLTMNLSFKNGIRAIGKESFKDCVGLTGKLTLPGSIVQIGASAFKGCTEISKIEILPYTGEKLDESKVSFTNDISYNIPVNENGTNNYIASYSDYTGVNQITVTNEIKDENGEVVKDENGNNVTESFTLIKRNITIGREAFSGCSSLTEIRLPAGVNKVLYDTYPYSIIEGCDNLTDLYIAMKKADMLEEVQTNGELNVHYLDCSHTVEVEEIEESSIEVISGSAGEGLATCQKNYSFKVNIAEESTLKGVVVKVGNKGEEKEAIKPDKNGIYTIENVTKDKEVSIEEGRIVEVRYEDKEGNKIAKSTILVGQEGESYKAERKEIANYRAYGEEPTNAEGTFTEEEIVVTYVYEKIPSGTITIKYQDKEGNDIIDPEEKQGYVGDEYEVERKNIKGYKAYGVTPENAKGTYTEEDMEIIFVYEEIKETETVIKYIDKDGNYIARDKTIQEGEEASKEAKDIEGYEKVEKEEEGKEITYTYKKVDKIGKENKWTTEKTLMAIAGIIGVLILILIIIARREKEVEMNGKKYKTIEEAIEEKERQEEDNKGKIEIKLLKDIERDEEIEGLDDETIKIDYNGYEIKIN